MILPLCRLLQAMGNEEMSCLPVQATVTDKARSRGGDWGPRSPALIAAACVGKDEAGEEDTEQLLTLGSPADSTILRFREQML